MIIKKHVFLFIVGMLSSFNLFDYEKNKLSNFIDYSSDKNNLKEDYKEINIFMTLIFLLNISFLGLSVLLNINNIEYFYIPLIPYLFIFLISLYFRFIFKIDNFSIKE